MAVFGTKIKFFILIFPFLFGNLSGQIINKNAIAAATVVKGKVWIKPESSPQRLLKIGEQIFPGDTVFTSDSGYAEITFLHGKRIIKLQSNSEIIFQMKQVKKALLPRVIMKIGKIWMKIFGSGTDTEIETPNAVVSVKGTEFLLIFSPKTGTQLFVLEGIVELSNEFGKVLVPQKQQSKVENDSPPIAPKPTTEEDIIDLWSSKTQINPKMQTRDALLRALIKKIGIADSLKDFILDNVKIIGGDQNVNEYLQFILKQDSDKIHWELETAKDGTKQLKIIIFNFQQDKP